VKAQTADRRRGGGFLENYQGRVVAQNLGLQLAGSRHSTFDAYKQREAVRGGV